MRNAYGDPYQGRSARPIGYRAMSYTERTRRIREAVSPLTIARLLVARRHTYYSDLDDKNKRHDYIDMDIREKRKFYKTILDKLSVLIRLLQEETRTQFIDRTPSRAHKTRKIKKVRISPSKRKHGSSTTSR
jgi:hypothetical protein